MSVRNAAGRDQRLERHASPTVDPLATRHLTRRVGLQAHPRSGGGRRRTVAPLVVCLIAVAFAVVEPFTAASRGGGTIALAAGRSLPFTASGSARADGGPGDAATAVIQPAANASPQADRPGSGSPGRDGQGQPPCTHDDVPAPHASLDEWATTIVDTAFVLPRGYAPPDLVPVGRAGIAGWGLIRSLVIEDLRALAASADAAGNPIAVQSAYRDRSRQAEVHASWVANSGEADAGRFSARPGHSEHQLGTALDLRPAASGAPWTGGFGSTAAGRWLARHAPEYGFVLSYPAGAEAVTCYGGEAWHVRYVGREVAARVAESGLALRVWLWRFGGGH